MSSKKKVLVIQAIHPRGMAVLQARDDIELVETSDVSQENLTRMMPDVHGIVVRTAIIDRPVISAANALRVVVRHGVGYDAVDVDALTARGIPLIISPGNALSVAEQTLYFMLALAKQGRSYDRATRGGNFQAARASMRAVDLDGRTLLIIGFGRTGTQVAPRAAVFGMRVLVYDPYIDREAIMAAGYTPVSDFRSVLPEVDVLSVHCPLTDETSSMVGADELACLRPGAFVINCARGGIVDEPALLEALGNGHLGGAGIDVFVGEPTPPTPDNPLFAFDNVVVSPHTAGVSLEASIRTSQAAAHNLLAALDGRPDAANVVNKEVLAN